MTPGTDAKGIRIAPGGRVPAYDLMRWVAIVMVVTIHVTAYATLHHPGSGMWMLNRAMQAAVPLFVFITGALVWTREIPDGAKGYLRFVQRRLITIGIPFVLWTVVYRLSHTKAGAPALLQPWWWRDLAVDIACGTAHFHLYFVPLIFVIYLVAPLAYRAARRWPAGSLVAAFVVVSLLWPLTEGIDVKWRWLVQAATLSPFAFAGAWYRFEVQGVVHPIRRWWPLLLAAGFSGAILHPLPEPVWQAVGGSWALQSADRALVMAIHMATAVGMLGACAAVLRALPDLSAWAMRTAPLVFGVYFLHPWAVLGLQRVSAYVPGGAEALSVPRALVIVALSTAISGFVAWLLSLTRATAWTIGLPGPRR